MPVVKIRYQGRVRQVRARPGATVAEVSRLAGINPQTVLFRVKDKIVPDDSKLKGGEKLEALKIVSGG
ncbi:MAG: MoaD/ThiS family protein [Candidatus Aenigmatarchaeota archaeon]